MCLLLDSSNIDPRKPIKEDNIRWKVLNNGFARHLESPYYNCVWKFNDWKTAKRNYFTQSKDIGFHVFLSKKDAIHYSNAGDVIVKIEVKDHNYSGITIASGKNLKTETWKKARVIEVYTSSGRHNITKRFK
jgi:hypothetical protein